ncbi:MBOAT family O-acyltransferase [Salidesulfovibrio onnuriiensis]|uniref:MBOAT family O-acyltransferase n=1 Tax=Salidesulfovibrio onnuriiensis TaxID=2583823 RepID=UPI0011CBAF58|nr:MBOAT family O-acyltransferase [Salidesulfovibrio onnuriiensis]
MLFSSLEFLIFFLCVCGFLALVRSNTSRKLFLLAASYYFYAYWDYRFLSLILLSTLTDYCVGRALEITEDKGKRRWLLVASLVVNLGLLGYFKYCNFFIESAAPLLEKVGLHAGTLDIILPVGISFYTFQTLSYTIDVYRRKMPVCRSLFDFALFVAFFPQLVAGPIVRAAHFLPQLALARPLNRDDLYEGFRRFTFGLTKKVFLADRLAMYVDFVFENSALMDTSTLWLGVVAYTLQIYFDFSGYSDMAIGAARMMGYDLGENFNFPYLSRSFSEFWRRWHISLSSWVRDYLYIPLGGNRGGAARTSLNLMLTMLLMGLWHGAAWTFVFWGGLHGLGLVTERLVFGKESIRPPHTLVSGLLGWGYTILVAVVGWVFFRAQSFGAAWTILEGMFVPRSGVIWIHPFVAAVVAGTALLHMAKGLARTDWLLTKKGWYTPALLFSLLWLVVIFYPTGFTPFIYFQF